MGDHRASIKIEFTFHGETHKQEWWINWWPDESTGCDRRITDWFRDCAHVGYEKYEVQLKKYWQTEHAKEIEDSEREELRRLQEKYPQ